MKYPKLTWRQPGGLPECPYFIRYIIDFKFFALKLHHWLGPDDNRAYHDHPYWFITVVLKGGYSDISPDSTTGEIKIDKLKFLSVRFRPADYKHTVQQVLPNTWTFLITGRSIRRWGFWLNGKLIKRDKYFVTHGHHPCDPADKPIRLRPDRSRVE